MSDNPNKTHPSRRMRETKGWLGNGRKRNGVWMLVSRQSQMIIKLKCPKDSGRATNVCCVHLPRAPTRMGGVNLIRAALNSKFPLWDSYKLVLHCHDWLCTSPTIKYHSKIREKKKQTNSWNVGHSFWFRSPAGWAPAKHLRRRCWQHRQRKRQRGGLCGAAGWVHDVCFSAAVGCVPETGPSKYVNIQNKTIYQRVCAERRASFYSGGSPLFYVFAGAFLCDTLHL